MAFGGTRGLLMNPMMTRLGRAILASVLLLLLGGVAVVAAADVGHKDFVDSGGSAVTGSKPESKAWFNDGTWWASMQSSSSSGFWIYKLDSNDNWVKTSTPLDPRNATRADTLWDGTHLYIASQKWVKDGGATGTGTNGETRLYRFSYSGGTYSLDNGFPASMRTNLQSETLVIAKDSTGVLWATWTRAATGGNLVYTNHTVGNNEASWTTPAFLPVGSQGIGVTTAADDISTIIAFTVGGEHRIGVFWSNQTDDKDYFAWHVDGAADNVWTGETALSGNGQADDHMNIKTDSSGQVYVVVKTSLTGANPLIKLLRRTTGGSWNNFVVGMDNVGSNTRPILELEQKGSGNILHVFMTGARTSGGSGQSGGDTFEKTSPVSSISFPTGLGTTVIRDDASAKMNDATSTKQNVDSTTGVVVLAFNDTTDFYWHARETLGGAPSDPQASFTANPPSGPSPLNVQFTNTSTGTGTLTYAWDFDNNGTTDDTSTSPSHQFTSPATYTVKLTVTGTNGTNSTTQQIQVNAPSSTITLTPDADAQVKSDSATTNYGALASVRTREDPGTASTYRTYLRFNVAGLTGSVTGVKIRLFTSDASPNVQSVYPILTNPNWIETGTGSITWTNAPSIGLTQLGSASVPTVGAYNEITLSPTSISGNGLVTFAIKSSSTDSAIFNSKEAAANPPQLVISQTTAPPNTAPTANGTSATTNEDVSTPVALSGSDPETCPSTFTIVAGPAHGTLGSIAVDPCVIASPNTETASVTYTPTGNYNGLDSFTYKVNDGTTDSALATASLTVTSVNDVPTAGDISVTAAQGTPKVITLTGADVETCDLNFTILTLPTNGTLSGGTTVADQGCVGSGPSTDSAQVTYTATSGSSDSFTYKVTDGSSADSLTATVTITITPPNAAPTADAKTPSTNEDTPATVTLTGTDAETCGLTFAFTQPAHGSVGALNSPAGCGSGPPFPDSATVTYTPVLNFNGTDTFTYTVNDGTTTSAPATVTVTVNPINDAATASAVTVTTAQNTAKTITLTGTDVETCPLAFAKTNPSHGGLGVITDQGCTGSGPFTDTATVIYTPTSGYSGGDAFTYTVDDGSGPSSAATVSITVTGGSPTTITLNPVADSHINSATASVTKNYGTLNPVRTREDPATPNSYRPYFQFNVPALSGSVSSVKLRVFVTTGSSSVTQSVYLVGNGWTETGINWSNAPVPSGSAIGSAVAGTSGAYVEFTLTTPVTSNSTVSFALVSSGTSSVYFSTREDATNKPQLVIVSGP
jgi:hypothetical protein